MTNDIPEEDKLLKQNPPLTHIHEWVDMYGGGGFRKGRPDVFLQSFFCKWCLQIRTKQYDGSIFNKNVPDDELNDPDDGQIA